MHSAQSSEAIAAHILATLSEFEPDHQHPNTGKIGACSQYGLEPLHSNEGSVNDREQP